MPVKSKRTLEDYFPYFGTESAIKPEEIHVESHNLGTISASGNYFILTAPSDIIIKKIKIVVDTAISISTTNYWTVQLSNRTQLPVEDLLATADNFNYDTAMTADGVYEITPDQNTTLNDGDVLELQLTKVSSGANLSGLYVDVEYIITGYATTTSTSTTTTTTTTTTTSTTTTVTTTSSSTTSTSSSTTTS